MTTKWVSRFTYQIRETWQPSECHDSLIKFVSFVNQPNWECQGSLTNIVHVWLYFFMKFILLNLNCVLCNLCLLSLFMKNLVRSWQECHNLWRHGQATSWMHMSIHSTYCAVNLLNLVHLPHPSFKAPSSGLHGTGLCHWPSKHTHNWAMSHPYRMIMKHALCFYFL